MDELKYPVGKFSYPTDITQNQLNQWISIIEAFPDTLGNKVNGLSQMQLSRRYRPGGWTIRQVVHHLADSHMNSFIRFKLALTEEKPTIKGYEEAQWAELPDGQSTDISDSLVLIQGLHARWTLLLRSLVGEDWGKSFIHPESGREIRLDQNLALYAWHCDHHLAHIDLALKS